MNDAGAGELPRLADGARDPARRTCQPRLSSTAPRSDRDRAQEVADGPDA
jgi:hypothetical protein